MIVGTVLVVAAGAACKPSPKPPVEAKAATTDSADQILFGVRSPITEDGVKRGVMYADTVYVHSDQYVYDCRMGKMDFNTSSGVPNGTMRADRCRYETRTQVLEGWGNVVVVMVDGRSLHSPHVRFDRPRNLLTSDTTYVFAGSGKRQYGVGFQTDTAFNNFRCLRACGGELPVAQSGQ